MLPDQILQAHYKDYAGQSDEWVSNMEITKCSIVRQVVKAINFKPTLNSVNSIVNVVVLGASDKRYIPIHKRVFETVLKTNIQMTTFDVETAHLGGKTQSIVKHDVNKPFPNKLYDIIFSHELMKFLTPEEQIQVMKNSYHALSNKGFAMHIMHVPSIKGTSELRSWQYRVSPDSLLAQLQKENIPVTKLVFNSESSVDWLRETTVIVIKKSNTLKKPL